MGKQVAVAQEAAPAAQEAAPSPAEQEAAPAAQEAAPSPAALGASPEALAAPESSPAGRSILRCLFCGFYKSLTKTNYAELLVFCCLPALKNKTVYNTGLPGLLCSMLFSHGTASTPRRSCSNSFTTGTSAGLSWTPGCLSTWCVITPCATSLTGTKCRCTPPARKW